MNEELRDKDIIELFFELYKGFTEYVQDKHFEYLQREGWEERDIGSYQRLGRIALKSQRYGGTLTEEELADIFEVSVEEIQAAIEFKEVVGKETYEADLYNGLFLFLRKFEECIRASIEVSKHINL